MIKQKQVKLSKVKIPSMREIYYDLTSPHSMIGFDIFKYYFIIYSI